MKMGIKILLGISALGVMSYLVFGTSLQFSGNTPSAISDSILVKTKWKQMGGFEKYTPDHLRLGCWSTALAQIMYYHQLKPFGNVSYISRNGYVINEKIDSASVDFKSMVKSIDSSTTKSALDATAKFNYYAALAVRKDFGTDRYMNKLAPASLFEQHYQAEATRYISWKHTFPYSFGKLKNVIIRELGLKRPLMLHFSDLKGFGHTVVIDAYRTENNKLIMHLNQGQGGPQDGWYDFDSAIIRPNDDNLRVLYTFKPNQP
jgi:hypothetical protein